MSLKLSDNTIAQIAKCVQVAILTGTDIVDHLRQLELEINDDQITVSKEYESMFNANIEKMLQTAVEITEELEEKEAFASPEQISLFS